MTKVKMPIFPRKDMPIPSGDDISRILAACDKPRDRAIIFMLLDTGLRISELAALDVADVSVADGSVLVRMGKGQRSRTTYASPRTVKQLVISLALRSDVQPDSPLFVSEKTGKRLTKSGVVQLMQKISQRSGVKVTAHMFRRYFAVKSLESGMSVYHLMRMGGWGSMEAMRPYIALSEADVRRAAGQHSVVESYFSHK